MRLRSYGLAVTGLQVRGTAGRTALTTGGLRYEPNVRGDQNATLIHPTVHASGLEPGKRYTMVRYVGTASLPRAPPFKAPNCTMSVVADADGAALWEEAPALMSDEAAYHFTTEPHLVHLPGET